MEVTALFPAPVTVDKNSVTSLYTEITEIISGKTILVGIGNSMRGDDGAGPALIDSIVDRISAECINAGSVPENYLEKMAALQPQTILFIDAANFYGLPGEIRMLSPEAVCDGICSTHTGSMELITAYLRRRIPGVRLTVIGIQSQALKFNALISRKVQHAIDALAYVFLQVFQHA
ncbi:MAG: hydrogenase maturation protease [Chitinispirillaceae bacterium]|nr:hydrogenase maturation protease [Chitinispirillaceae bacterium]